MRRALLGSAAVAAALLALAPASCAAREAVPILMYHAIRTAPPGADHPRLWVRPREFAAQVRALREAGYTGITLQRAWDAWHGRARLPRRPIVFSFDDGYASQVRIALPVLRRAGWAGVLNLTLSHLDDLGGPAAVRRLIDGGWEIDAHTRTHADLTVLSDERLRDEVAAAREEIRGRFGVPASFFCYPAGRYDARVVAAVRAAGFQAAMTVKMGLATAAAPYLLKRVQVDSGLGGDGLLRRLRTLRNRAAGR